MLNPNVYRDDIRGAKEEGNQTGSWKMNTEPLHGHPIENGS